MMKLWFEILDSDVIASLYSSHVGNSNLIDRLKNDGKSEDEIKEVLSNVLRDIIPFTKMVSFGVGAIVLDQELVTYRVKTISANGYTLLRVEDDVIVFAPQDTIFAPIPPLFYSSTISVELKEHLNSIVNSNLMLTKLLTYNGRKVNIGNLYVGDEKFANELIICNTNNHE